METVVYDNYLKVVQSKVKKNGVEKVMEKVSHPDSVTVFLLDYTAEAVILVKQYRYPVDAETIEAVAGKIEEGETPMAAAIREVLEETGYLLEENQIRPIGEYWKSPGYTTEKSHMFFAYVKGNPKEEPTEEGVEVVSVPLEKFLLGNTGKIECLSTSYFRWMFNSLTLATSITDTE